MAEQTSITDVLSGNAPVKVQVDIDKTMITILIVGVFIAVTVGVIIARKLS